MGINVMAVSKVSDDVDVIADEVKIFSKKYDYVLTTGGIGPTHDDKTYEGVAKAFDDKVHCHPQLAQFILKFYKTSDPNHPALKLACIPTTAKLTYGFDPVHKKKAVYPAVSVKNVFMFPGVPELCERLFNFTKDQLFIGDAKSHTRELYLSVNESLIVGQLNDAVTRYPNVTFGSYPKFFHSYYLVKITMESNLENYVEEALQYLKKSIPRESHVDYDANPFSDKLIKMNKLNFKVLTDTISLLETTLKQYDPSDVFIYFDGGKNSTVLLHIVSALYEKLFPKSRVSAVYVETNPKVNSYVEKSIVNYNVKLLRLSEKNFMNFAKCCSGICIVKGIRKSDLRASAISKSVEGLPIVNPLADWTYHDVWKTIRALYLPYCDLYDKGHTFICDSESFPNPNLRTIGPHSDMVYYKKAYELEDEALEYDKI